MIFSILQLTAILLTFVSAYFISKANLGLSSKAIAELAVTKYAANLELAKSFATQNGDNWVGVVALLLSLAGQIFVTFFPHNETFTIDLPVGVIALGVTALTTFILGKYSAMRSRKLAQEAEEIIRARQNKS